LERGEIEPAGQDLAEMVEAQPRLTLHAAEEEREERQDHEHDERENGAPHDHVLEPQARAPGRPRKARRQPRTPDVRPHSKSFPSHGPRFHVRSHWCPNPAARANIPRRGGMLHTTFGRIARRASARWLRSRPSYLAITHVLHRSRGAFPRPGFLPSFSPSSQPTPERGDWRN